MQNEAKDIIEKRKNEAITLNEHEAGENRVNAGNNTKGCPTDSEGFEAESEMRFIAPGHDGKHWL